MLKSALEHAVREEEIPRNVARNVCTGTPRPRRFEPLTADEARQFLTAAQGHRLHALFELALHVFTTVQGRPIDPTNLTRAFTTLLRKAGLRRIRFHDLRHSTATLLLEQGVELVVIKELLGHAHIGVTATVYAHVRLRLQRDAIDALGTALGSPETTETVNGDGDEPPSCAAFVR